MHLVKLTAFLLVVLFTSDSTAADVKSMCEVDFPAEPCRFTITITNSDYEDPDQWYQLGEGSCVKAVSQPKLNWFHAESACSIYSHGFNYGHLVSIRDEQELNGTICTAFRRLSHIRRYWIGLNKVQGEENLWTDGTEDGFINWAKNQPNFLHVAQYCVEINYHDWGEYNDAYCPQFNAFICQVRFE